jgi:hypothetical protein
VEKRPSRHQCDGKTILEKAQERKKKANLDDCKGNSKTYNPFSVLLNHEISSLAEVTGISLGNSDEEISSMLADIQECDNMRAKNFRDSCSSCHVEIGESSVGEDGGCDNLGEGDVALVTPQMCS